jgi:hypothetical protein
MNRVLASRSAATVWSICSSALAAASLASRASTVSRTVCRTVPLRKNITQPKPKT